MPLWENTVLSAWSIGGATSVTRYTTYDPDTGTVTFTTAPPTAGYTTFASTTYDPVTGITTITRRGNTGAAPVVGTWEPAPAPFPPGPPWTVAPAPPGLLGLPGEPDDAPPPIPGALDEDDEDDERPARRDERWCERHGRPNCRTPVCVVFRQHEVQRHDSAVVQVEGCIPCEQEVAQRARHRLAHERREQRTAAMHEANSRARTLLMSLLSPENRERFEHSHHILIRGSDGAQWRIECNSYTGNVVRLGEDGFHRRYCAHPTIRVRYEDDGFASQIPLLDAIIGQMLLLETNAERFLEIANPY